jgi:hypothetical protein
MGPADQDRPPDQIRLRHHQVDRFLLRFGKRPRFENRAPRADKLQKAVSIDVLFEERTIGRVAIDVPFFDVYLLLLQKTSGVAAGRSRGLPVEDRLGHSRHSKGRREKGKAAPTRR